LIYVYHRPEDEEFADGIASALLHRKLEVVLPALDGDPAELEAFHRENLQECESVVLCWAKAPEVWVRATSRSLRDREKLGRSRRFAARVLIVGPPPGGRKSAFVRLPPTAEIDTVLDLSTGEEPSAEALEPLGRVLLPAAGELRLTEIIDRCPDLSRKLMNGISNEYSLTSSTAEEGTKVVTGGERAAHGGSFFEPTVLTDVTTDVIITKEETFGPVAPLYRMKSEAEAIEMANNTNSVSPPISTAATAAAPGAWPRPSNTAPSAATRASSRPRSHRSPRHEGKRYRSRGLEIRQRGIPQGQIPLYERHRPLERVPRRSAAQSPAVDLFR
jgi:hypothetical protein